MASEHCANSALPTRALLDNDQITTLNQREGAMSPDARACVCDMLEMKHDLCNFNVELLSAAKILNLIDTSLQVGCNALLSKL